MMLLLVALASALYAAIGALWLRAICNDAVHHGMPITKSEAVMIVLLWPPLAIAGLVVVCIERRNRQRD